MSRPVRTFTVAALVGAAGLSVVTAAPASATAGAEPVEKVVSTTTTTDVNVRAVASAAPITDALVDRATSGPVRLAGSDRYGTSVQISRRAFPGTARTVYLVGGTRTDEALAATALTDGPVLLVPTTGALPDTVAAEITRLAPQQVVAVGGTTSVSASMLTTAAQGRSTSRIGSDDPVTTATEVARRAFPNGARTVYLAQQGGSADAVSGGSLSDGPVLPVPATGPASTAVRSAVTSLGAQKVVALGGTAAISADTLTSAASGLPTGRLAGADRYQTGQAIARAAFPQGTPVAYLADGTVFADVLAGGVLRDGPVLLAPPAKATTQTTTVATTLTGLGVRNVGSLGGAAVLSDARVTGLVAKVPSATTTSLPTYTVPGTAPAPGPAPAPAPAPTSGSGSTGTSGSSGSTATTSGYTPAPPPPAETCESVVASFRPVPMSSKYTITCAADLGGASTLGVTESWLAPDTGELVEGTIRIRSDLQGNVLRAVIAHELAHGWSYANLTDARRTDFARYLGLSSFSAGDYLTMPAEVWARTQATCVGWPDGYNRKQLTCDELRPYGWN